MDEWHVGSDSCGENRVILVTCSETRYGVFAAHDWVDVVSLPGLLVPEGLTRRALEGSLGELLRRGARDLVVLAHEECAVLEAAPRRDQPLSSLCERDAPSRTERARAHAITQLAELCALPTIEQAIHQGTLKIGAWVEEESASRFFAYGPDEDAWLPFVASPRHTLRGALPSSASRRHSAA